MGGRTVGPRLRLQQAGHRHQARVGAAAEAKQLAKLQSHGFLSVRDDQLGHPQTACGRLRADRVVELFNLELGTSLHLAVLNERVMSRYTIRRGSSRNSTNPTPFRGATLVSARWALRHLALYDSSSPFFAVLELLDHVSVLGIQPPRRHVAPRGGHPRTRRTAPSVPGRAKPPLAAAAKARRAAAVKSMPQVTAAACKQGAGCPAAAALTAAAAQRQPVKIIAIALSPIYI